MLDCNKCEKLLYALGVIASEYRVRKYRILLKQHDVVIQTSEEKAHHNTELV